MGMLFELIADLRRWMSDRQVNNYPVKLIHLNKNEGLTHEIIKSSQLKVGNIIILEN